MKTPRSPSPSGVCGALVVIAIAAMIPGAAAQDRIFHLFRGSPGAWLGSSVAGVGDVDGDGCDDVATGAVLAAAAGAITGGVEVRSGRDGTVVWSRFGDTAGDALGASVASAGDVDADGVPDLVVGATQPQTGAGYARVYSGVDGRVLHTFHGFQLQDLFGAAVDSAGDVDGDGHDDVIVGAFAEDTGGDAAGFAQLFSGANGSVLYTFVGTQPQSFFGLSVTGVGDVDGDGRDDFAIGAPFEDAAPGAAGNQTGVVRVYSGLDGAVLHVFAGAAGDLLGVSLDTAGDLDADGVPDLVAGSPGADQGGFQAGRVLVFSGASGQIIATRDGAVLEFLGVAVAGAGDVNGDGVPDLVAGAFGASVNGPESGAARVYSGADGAVLASWNGSAPFDHFGTRVAGPGDVNGDGFDDVVVAALHADANGIDAGAAAVFAICGAYAYGVTAASPQTLALDWQSGPPGFTSPGQLVASGAPPGSAGFVVVSLAPAAIPFYDLTILVDPSPAVAIGVPVVFDGTGSVAGPLDLRSPGLAGAAFAVQAFAVSQVGVFSSPGLGLLFCR